MEEINEKLPREKQINDDLDNKSNANGGRTTQKDDTGISETLENQQFPSDWYRTDCQYKNAREYAQVLQAWLWQYRFFSAMNTFHYHLVSSMPLQYQPHNIGFNPVTSNQQSTRNQPSNVPRDPVREGLIQPAGRTAHAIGILDNFSFSLSR